MRDETVIDIQEADEMHEAMDYAQHERTWEGVTNLVKSAILQLAFILVGLYCCIIANAPFVGVVLILVGLVAPFAMRLFMPRR
jgi:hypothetical protein